MKTKFFSIFLFTWIIATGATVATVFGANGSQRLSKAANMGGLDYLQDLHYSYSLVDGIQYEPPEFFSEVHYGAFANVTYYLQPNVIRVNGVFSPEMLQSRLKLQSVPQGNQALIPSQTKLMAGALIPKNELEALIPSTRASGQEISIGSIIVDEQNGVAFKITGTFHDNQGQYYELTRPQLHEVLRDFEIPKQAVYLTMDNLTPASQEVARSMSATTRGAATNRIKDQFPDPLVCLEFNNQTFNVPLGEDQEVEIVLDGVLIIDKVRLDGGYSCFGGYHFQVGVGEGIGLDANVKSQIDQEVAIPLFAIDVPAGIGHVRGGLYLIVGLNGKFTIGVSMGEWAKATLGLKGGTSFCVPTSFHPIGSFDKSIFGNADFAGEINGQITAGPMVDLELFGWDVAGAGAFAGFGASCNGAVTSDGFYLIKADLYVPIHFYLTFVGEDFNLINNKIMLAQIQKVYSAGTDSSGNVRKFDVTFQEACAYRHEVWGKVLDLDAPPIDNKPAPLKNSAVEITVKRQNNQTKYYGTTDNNGYFSIHNVDLYKDDEIRVTKLAGVNVSSIAINPTFPFKQIHLDYADFFDDSAKGQVAPARVVDWDATNQLNSDEFVYKEIFYNGDITFEIEDSTSRPRTQSDSNGNFHCQYDFKPKKKVTAHITWQGFDVPSNWVWPDTYIRSFTLREEISTSAYSERGVYTKGRKIVEDHTIMINMRGNKSFGGIEIEGTSYYFFVRLPYFICVGPDVVPISPLVGSVKFTQKIPPDDNPPDGASSFDRYFLTEWEWPSREDGTLRTPNFNTYSLVDDLSFGPGVIQFDTTLLQDPIIAAEFATEQTYFAFKPAINLFSEDICSIIDSKAMDPTLCQAAFKGYKDNLEMVYYNYSPISHLVKLAFQYEGVEVPVISDYSAPAPSCKEPIHAPDPVDQLLRDKIWSRINPAPVDVSNPISVIDQPYLDLNFNWQNSGFNTSNGQGVDATFGSGTQIEVTF